jgi:pseudouridine synthase
VAKALADAGVASRRASEALVFAGRVRVNGSVCMVPQTLVTPGQDSVEVDGAVVQLAAAAVRHYYFALYKPVGYLCSNAREGDKVVLDLFAAWLEKWKERAQSTGGASKPPSSPKAQPGAHAGGGGAAPVIAVSSKAVLPPRLFTVGRLDTATSGLILVTNDGAWAQRIAHPSSGISKEYIVTAADSVTKRQLATMAEGCHVEGVFVKPLRVEKVMTPDGGSPNRVLVELCDGRNHEVRMICAQSGVDVKHLKRVRVGGLRLSSALKPGQFQELTFKDAKQVVDADAQEEARGGSLARVPEAGGE